MKVRPRAAMGKHANLTLDSREGWTASFMRKVPSSLHSQDIDEPPDAALATARTPDTCRRTRGRAGERRCAAAHLYAVSRHRHLRRQRACRVDGHGSAG